MTALVVLSFIGSWNAFFRASIGILVMQRWIVQGVKMSGIKG